MHLRADYQRYDWRARATYNDADFYDLFGPTKTGRKGYTVGLGYHRTLLFDEPRRIDLETDAMFAGNLDRLPQYQNVAVDVDRLFTFEATLKGATSARRSAGWTTRKGRKWSVDARWQRAWRASGTGGRTAPFDVGTPLPLAHSSVWLRSAGGCVARARATIRSPISSSAASATTGSTAARRSGTGSTTRSPAPTSTRSAAATSSKSTLEWNLPPLRFRASARPGSTSPGCGRRSSSAAW